MAIKKKEVKKEYLKEKLDLTKKIIDIMIFLNKNNVTSKFDYHKFIKLNFADFKRLINKNEISGMYFKIGELSRIFNEFYNQRKVNKKLYKNVTYALQAFGYNDWELLEYLANEYLNE